MSDEDTSSRKDSCTDILDDGGNTSTIIDPDTDENALLDTALGEDNGEVEGDGELSLLDQDESQESVQIDDPVSKKDIILFDLLFCVYRKLRQSKLV